MAAHATKKNDDFIIENYFILTSSKIAKALNRTTAQVERRIFTLRKKGLLGRKIAHGDNCTEDIKLQKNGIQNSIYIAKFKRAIKRSQYFNLIIKNKKEKVEFIGENDSCFTVRRAHYKESFSYTDLLMGCIKIAK